MSQSTVRPQVRRQVPAQAPSLQGHQARDPTRGGRPGGLQRLVPRRATPRGLRVWPRDDPSA